MSGPKPTAVRIAEAQMINTSSSDFGRRPIDVGPDSGSKLVGKAQGICGSEAQDEFGLVMIFNFAFTEGKYNGSTLSLLRRNRIFSAVREMPIVGGSGAFRFARGYAQARTHTNNNKTRDDAVVEYNVCVFHY
ncbi:Dirigent protein 2 [Spatholobus suberectus]|nr:Dirigent protein 2 [Spatholobus suberectus]